MSDQRNPHDDDVFVADPASFEDELVAERPKWPKVVGILGMVLGVLGLVCGGLGLAWSFIGPKMMQSAAGSMEGGMPDVLVDPPGVVIAMQAIGTLWAILLVVAAATLLARRPAARPMHLVYAVVAVPLALWGISVQLDMNLQIAQWVKDNPDTDFARSQGAGGAIGQLIGLAFGIGLGVGWPVFLLVWFGFVKRKPEDITGGVTEAAA